LIIVAAALFGASVGSFLNVCIFRLPRRCLRLWKPKLSFCPGCHRTLQAWENVPVLAYLFLRGRCRGCKREIPFRYFLVELTTAILFVYLAQRDVLGETRNLDLFFVHAILGASLIVCGLVDWDHQVIPDEIDIPGFLLAPLVAFFVPLVFEKGTMIHLPVLASNTGVLLESALPWWGLSQGATNALTAPLHSLHDALIHTRWDVPSSAAFTSLVGASAGAGLIWAIGWAGDKLFKKPAMGFGDVKFMAMIGGFTGWQGVLYTVVAASILGSFYGIGSKVRSGRPTVTGKELAQCSPLSYLALRLFGAPTEAKDEEVVHLRWGGALAARFATGDSYLPFGPFLAIGGGICLYWPTAIYSILHLYTQFVVGQRGG
jgi:leader peptidase (prepilin peptidase)/N-methyltransferase